MAENTNDFTTERFSQLVRAGLPFNPISGQEIQGGNLVRLQRGMQVLGYTDPRFLTEEQALANGWSVKPNSMKLQIVLRDQANGDSATVAVLNAQSIEGIPSIDAMLAMSGRELSQMAEPAPDIGEPEDMVMMPARGLQRSPESQSVIESARLSSLDERNYQVIETNFNKLVEVPQDGLSIEEAAAIVPADIAALRGIVDIHERHFAADMIGSNMDKYRSYRDLIELHAPDLVSEIDAATAENQRRIDAKDERKRIAVVGPEVAPQPSVPLQPIAPLVGSGAAASIGGQQGPGEYAVLAPYWRDGLHNVEGLKLAEELNKVIKAGNMAHDMNAIERLLSAHTNAMPLGLEIVTQEKFRDDFHMKVNAAQPRTLLDGALIRDKHGSYRPAAGGQPVLEDKGDSVTLKSRDKDGYRAAMELALAKGWTAIELKGKPAMLAEAWLEAKLKGLDVVNYAPNAKDLANYADRLAQETAVKAQSQQSGAEQTPEMVEIRPFVDADGLQREAKITYTLERQGVPPQTFDKAKDAAHAFAKADIASMPTVLRTVTRIGNDVVRPDTIAGINVQPGQAASKYVDGKLDREFAEAVVEINEEENAPPIISPVNKGTYVGPIVAVDGNMIGQKTGRDPSQLTWHDASKLNGRKLGKDDMAEISYANGVGMVRPEQSKEKETDGLGRSISR